MKIIITESKINTIISKYIDKMFNDINYSYGYDDDGNEVDYAIEFYVGDYDDDDGRVTSDNKHTYAGYKPFYKTIMASPVTDNEFRGL